LLCTIAAAASSQPLPRGTIVDDVRCEDDPSQGYALYLPSDYAPDRAWNLLMAFHAGGRGRAMVERYQAAAERYGYIVAGSNTSRNGPWAVSAAAVRAMSVDLGRRFAIDADRVYLTGMSGGARVALEVALASKNIAGVIASSAGFADGRSRTSLPFAVFGTAGTEDFNYLEMRMLDRALKTPHRLAIFDGGHTLPPGAVALEAIEWMELHAMRTGRRSKDEELVGRLFETRQRAVAASTDPVASTHMLEHLLADFDGLRDISAEAARLNALVGERDIKRALAEDRAALDAEVRALDEIFQLESGLAGPDRRLRSLSELRQRIARLARAADAAQPGAEAERARRVLRTVTAGAAERVRDADYLELLAQYGGQPR
jgi:poly(3-hydroxybutyrate) depolymerase